MDWEKKAYEACADKCSIAKTLVEFISTWTFLFQKKILCFLPHPLPHNWLTSATSAFLPFSFNSKMLWPSKIQFFHPFPYYFSYTSLTIMSSSLYLVTVLYFRHLNYYISYFQNLPKMSKFFSVQ